MCDDVRRPDGRSALPPAPWAFVERWPAAVAGQRGSGVPREVITPQGRSFPGCPPSQGPLFLFFLLLFHPPFPNSKPRGQRRNQRGGLVRNWAMFLNRSSHLTSSFWPCGTSVSSVGASSSLVPPHSPSRLVSCRLWEGITARCQSASSCPAPSSTAVTITVSC